MNAMKLLGVGAVMVLLSAGTRAQEKVDYAKLIVGKWEATKADAGTIPVGTIVEFTKDGKMTVKHTPKEKGAKTTTLNGKFKAEGEKIDYTIDDGAGGTRGEILTIKKLTDDELVTVDPEGVQEDFKRAKEKEKKDEKK